MSRAGTYDGEIGRGRRRSGDGSSSSRDSSPARPGPKRSFSPTSDDGDLVIPPIPDDDTPPPSEGPLLRRAVGFAFTSDTGTTALAASASSISTYDANLEPASTRVFLPGQAVPQPPKAKAKKGGTKRPRKPDAYPGQTSRFRLQTYDPTPSAEPPMHAGSGPYSSLYRGTPQVAVERPRRRQLSADPSLSTGSNGGHPSSSAMGSTFVDGHPGSAAAGSSSGSAMTIPASRTSRDPLPPPKSNLPPFPPPLPSAPKKTLDDSRHNPHGTPQHVRRVDNTSKPPSSSRQTGHSQQSSASPQPSHGGESSSSSHAPSHSHYRQDYDAPDAPMPMSPVRDMSPPPPHASHHVSPRAPRTSSSRILSPSAPVRSPPPRRNMSPPSVPSPRNTSPLEQHAYTHPPPPQSAQRQRPPPQPAGVAQRTSSSSSQQGGNPTPSGETPAQRKVKQIPLRMVTLLITDMRSGTEDPQLAEVKIPLRPGDNPADGFWADAKDIGTQLQSSPARIDGPARAYTLRGRYRQFILRVTSDNVDEISSCNVVVKPDRTIDLVVELLQPPGQVPRPPQIPRELWSPAYDEPEPQQEYPMDVEARRENYDIPNSRKRINSPSFDDYDSYRSNGPPPPPNHPHSNQGPSKVPRHDYSWQTSPRRLSPPRSFHAAMERRRQQSQSRDQEPHSSYPNTQVEYPPVSPRHHQPSVAGVPGPLPPPVPAPPPQPVYSTRNEGPSDDDMTPPDEPFIRSVDRLIQEDHEGFSEFFRKRGSSRACDAVAQYTFVMRMVNVLVGRQPPGFVQLIEESHIIRALQIDEEGYLERCKETMRLLQKFGKNGSVLQDPRVMDMLHDMKAPPYGSNPPKKLLKLLQTLEELWKTDGVNLMLDGINPPPKTPQSPRTSGPGENQPPLPNGARHVQPNGGGRQKQQPPPPPPPPSQPHASQHPGQQRSPPVPTPPPPPGSAGSPPPSDSAPRSSQPARPTSSFSEHR